MTYAINNAYKILGYFWLEEVKLDDADTITALPELAGTLAEIDAATLTGLAVEYQRLFGFNLPPYESVFIDPSSMLMAPATERVQSLYRQGGWELPATIRAGAPDHLGAELLALAHWRTSAQLDLAHYLHTRHLALWAPVFVITLQRLAPHPFYHTLADLTLELLLSTLEAALPQEPNLQAEYLFPSLPPPPVYRGTEAVPFDEPNNANTALTTPSPLDESPAGDDPAGTSLRKIVKHLLTAREAGLYLTREDLASLGEALDLPGLIGERHRMLDGLFRQAGQYDLIPNLVEQVAQLVRRTGAAYRRLADQFPSWQAYAAAWEHRLKQTTRMLEEMQTLAAQLDENPR